MMCNKLTITSLVVNRLQKEIRTKINQESTISWGKFCNSISLESDPRKSWRTITNFLKPKGPRSYPMLKLDSKTPKPTPNRPNSLPKVSVKTLTLRVICFANYTYLFHKSHDRINNFVALSSFIPFHTTRLDPRQYNRYR